MATDPVLARDLEAAEFWVDRGLGMAQQAIRSYARGIKLGTESGALPVLDAVTALRIMADLLEHLKTHRVREGSDERRGC